MSNTIGVVFLVIVLASIGFCFKISNKTPYHAHKWKATNTTKWTDNSFGVEYPIHSFKLSLVCIECGDTKTRKVDSYESGEAAKKVINEILDKNNK